MAAIGLRGALGYGAKYLATLVAVLTLGGAIAGGGWYVATLAGASLLAPSVAALTVPQAAAGLALVVLGALVTTAGLLGMAFKFLADAAAVGADEALADAAAPEVVDAATTTGDAEDRVSSTGDGDGADSPATDAADDGATEEDEVEESAGHDESSPQEGRPADPSPTAGQADDPSPAGADGGGDDARAPESATDPVETAATDPSTAPEPNAPAEDATDPGADAPETAAAGTADHPEPATAAAGASDGSSARAAGAGETEPAPARTTAGSGRDDDAVRPGDGPPDDVVDRAGAAVAEAIEFEQLSDDGDGPAADAEGSAAVPDRETRVEPAGHGRDRDGLERDRSEGDRSEGDRTDDAGVVDEYDTKAEEWTPPDPEEFERETATGGGSGRNGDGRASGEAGDASDADEGPDADSDDASTDGLLEDEDLTLADEGVDTVDVSVDDDPLADRLPGGDG